MGAQDPSTSSHSTAISVSVNLEQIQRSKIWDEDNPSFAYRGGQIIGKIDFIKSVLSAYQVSKPIFMTEVSLSCKEEEVFCTTEQALFWDLQADFVVSSNLRSWGEGLIGTIWYTLEESDWRGTGLHINTGAPKPGYYALQFMSNELKDATVKAKISDYPGLRGYKFELPAKNVWVLWTPDGVTGITIPLPSGTNAIYDKFGNPIALTDPITIVHPTYFELLP